MPYNPREFPNTLDVYEIRKFLEQELRNIAIAMNETTETHYRPLGHEPARPQNGLVAFADGTHWNPGGGAGLYQRVGGVWVKL